MATTSGNAAATAPLPRGSDGVFGSVTMATVPPVVANPTVTLVQPAGPPRTIPTNSRSGKPQEPTLTEWDAAAKYSIKLHLPSDFNASATEIRLNIDYEADAARVYYGNRLLTDNWYSGFKGDGACEVCWTQSLSATW